MKPLGNLVLLEPLAKPVTSPGGIVLVDRYQDDRMQYTVVAIGPGRRLKDGCRLLPEVRPGDRCLCHTARINKQVLPDGRILVDADQILMVWR